MSKKVKTEIDMLKPGEHKAFDYENNEVILDVRHLKQFFRFGRGIYKYTKAVHDVSFKVYKGEVFGLVGESGCGKTTTGRSIIRLYDITSGDVWFKGQRIAAGTRWNEKEIKFTNIRLKKKLGVLSEIRKQLLADLSETGSVVYEDITFTDKKLLNEHFDKLVQEEKTKAAEICKEQRQKIKLAKKDHREGGRSGQTPNELNVGREKLATKMQMIFQDPIASLDPRMTVRDIIAEGLVINTNLSGHEINKKVAEMLKLVGLLPEHMTRYPHEFSGGQRQRIGIARALILEPELVIADEPVSALDVSIQAQVINLLNDLREKMGLTILFIAHNLSVVKYFCDRIAVMYYGEIVELATSEDLFKNPLHPYTASLLSAVPTPDPNKEKNRERKRYNPTLEHDYSIQKPTLREVFPNHFVLCNDDEEAKYKKNSK